MSAGTICSRIIVTAMPGESVRTAARRMAENEVGTVVVLHPELQGRPLGIITDRDLAVRCVARGIDPDETPISRIMTTPVVSVEEHTPLVDALSRMSGAAVRRVVVTGEEGRAVGILSLDDALDLLVVEANSLGRLLEKQRPALNLCG